MSPIQQMLLGVGAVDSKTYVDDVFSTFLYKGTGSAQSINNGIDLSSEGGMVWIKQRTGQFTNSNFLFDTKRGTGKYVKSDSSATEDTSNLTLSAFNSNGFSVGSSSTVNLDYSSYQGTYNSWSFRKAPGFLDIIEWSGNGANRLINHNLGSVPGMVVVKCTSHSQNWQIWHKSFGYTHSFSFNRDAMPDTGASSTWNSTDPTATQISVGPSVVNASGRDYIAYVFAGGASTSSLARSVDFDGSGDYLLTNSSSDYTMGTGDFTVEGWFKTETYDKTFLQITDSSSGFSTSAANITLWVSSSGYYTFNAGNGEKSTNVKATKNIWEHLAYVRHNGTTSLYVNGLFIGSKADTHNYNGTYVNVGAGYSSSFAYDGKISNFRVVKGTAVYTSSFRPPTEPLTSISGTGLLCCNNSSVTGTTTGSVSSNGNPTASTDHPFDDSASFVFGENENQNVIKMGKYIGNGSESDGTEVYLGWEPTWLMVKRSNGTANWGIIDTMRGWTADGQGEVLFPNRNNNEDSGANSALPTSTGFKLHTTNNEWNGSNDEYMYVAIRRPDGYVGKPLELGTGVFNIDLAGINAGDPSWVSGFPVDMQFIKDRNGTTYNFYLSTRLTQGKYLSTTSNAAETANSVYSHDYQNGWGNYSSSDAELITSWMWKRHAGMDVVTYKGNGVQGRDIPHSLGVAPNMMWVKNRTRTTGGGAYWNVYVSGITHLSVYGSDPDNLGNNPVSLKLNDTDAAQFSGSGNWDHTHPTSTHFTVGDTYSTNQNGESMIAMLFSSISGISKVGSFTGTGATQTITLGFQPRFLILKMVNSSSGAQWYVLDTTRGWGSGDDNFLELNTDDAQTGYNFGAPTSTGFELTATAQGINASGDKMIYYAHA